MNARNDGESGSQVFMRLPCLPEATFFRNGWQKQAHHGDVCRRNAVMPACLHALHMLGTWRVWQVIFNTLAVGADVGWLMPDSSVIRRISMRLALGGGGSKVKRFTYQLSDRRSKPSGDSTDTAPRERRTYPFF